MHSRDFHAIASQMKAAQDDGLQIEPLTGAHTHSKSCNRTFPDGSFRPQIPLQTGRCTERFW
jgi:hypothetical protein